MFIRPPRIRLSYGRSILFAGLLLALVSSASAAALFGDGADARSIAVGGAETAQTGSAISAMSSNPAALASASQTQFEMDLGGAFVSGKFTRESGEVARTRAFAGFFPAAALAIPVRHDIPIVFGLAVLPDIMSAGDWRYTDAAGGLGGTTSYGLQRHRSKIIALRTNVGVAAKVTRWFSLGASVGAIYNGNELQAPYIFKANLSCADSKRCSISIPMASVLVSISARNSTRPPPWRSA
ncbi:MAG: hypothetical protein M3N48_02290 [Verrucomicrobiota bacterium]|nr:hypothetical protein [Verrucomicrobiota bacterium]